MDTLEWLKTHMSKLPLLIVTSKRIVGIYFKCNGKNTFLSLVSWYTLDAQRSKFLVIETLSLR